MPSNGRILIVEDDSSVRGVLAEYLGTHGYEVVQADRGTAMREAVANSLPDVVLLDVNLPGEDGLTLARFLRERYDVGIIMVTGATETADRVAGLEVGADDYVTKPFDLRELRARVKSVLRRMQARSPAEPVGAASGAPPSSRVRVGVCALDLAVPSAVCNATGDEIPITASEFDLLKLFAENPNRPLQRDWLLEFRRSPRDGGLRPCHRSSHHGARRKIEADPAHPDAIRTVRAGLYVRPAPRRRVTGMFRV